MPDLSLRDTGLFSIPAAPYSSQYDRYSRTDYNLSVRDALRVVPRRGWDTQTRRWMDDVIINPLDAFVRWQDLLPLRMLRILADIHPMVGMARSNWLTLAFGLEDTDFVAEDNSGNANKRGTRAIASLFEMQDEETGGYIGLQRTLGTQTLFYGTCCLEAVTDGGQVSKLVTFDPLSIRFKDADDGSRVVEQDQLGGWRMLPRDTVSVVGFDADSDNPYGRPLFSAALGEGLRDLDRQRNLDDVCRAIAWPRLAVGFPFDQLIKLATETPQVLIQAGPNGEDLSPGQYAIAQFQAIAGKLQTLKADDVLLTPAGGSATILNGAQGLSSMRDILDYNQQRLCMALDSLPTMLGIIRGGTLAYSTTEWMIQAKKIESFRGFVNRIICKSLNLHLRLLGLNVKAVAKVKKLQDADPLAVEQAMAASIANHERLIALGFEDRTSASFALTGTEPVLSDEEQTAKEDEQMQKEAALMGGAAGSN